MCVSTRSLPQQTPRSGCTPAIPLPRANTIDTNPDTGGRSSQLGVSQASTAMQGLSPGVYKQQPQRAQTMPAHMAQPQQTRTVPNPQGRQQRISSESRTTRTQQFQAGNSGGLVRRNALLGTRNVGMRGGAPSFVPAPATGVVSQVKIPAWALSVLRKLSSQVVNSLKAHLTILSTRQLEEMGSKEVAKGTLISAALERYFQ